MVNCPFSKYKNIFGEQDTGIHKYKFKGTAIFDYIFSIIGAFVLTYFTNFPLVLSTILILVLGIIFHFLFGVNTRTLQFFGINC
jgi:hypothetical protein